MFLFRTACRLRRTGGPNVIRKEAWPVYRTISGVRLFWELEGSKGPQGRRSRPATLFASSNAVGGGVRIHPGKADMCGRHGVQCVAHCVACAALTLVVRQ